MQSYIKDDDPVITKRLYVPTPRAAWRWCLGAGTCPPTHLKHSGTPSVCATAVCGTDFWPQTFCVCFLVGKGPRYAARPMPQHCNTRQVNSMDY